MVQIFQWKEGITGRENGEGGGGLFEESDYFKYFGPRGAIIRRRRLNEGRYYSRKYGNLWRVRLGSIRNKNNWNNSSKRLFGSYSHSGIAGFPYRLFCSQEQNSRNIFRNIILIPEYPKRTRP